MKKIFRNITCAVLLITSTVLCTACGSNGNNDSGDKVTIVVDDLVQDNLGLSRWLSARQQKFSSVYPNIIVKHVPEVSTDAFNQIRDIKQTLSVHNSSTPTILKVNTNEFARQLYYDGYTRPFTSQLSDWEEKNNLYEDVLSGYVYNQEIIGFPTEIDTPLLGFNKSILKERENELREIGQDYKNLSIQSWEEYIKIVQVLTYKNSSNAMVAGMGATTQDYYQTFGIWATANGFDGVVQNEDGTISIDFAENESMVQTLQMLSQLRLDNIIYYSPDVQTTNYYGYIWNNRIASFTFYPQWATWFSKNGLGTDEIDVYAFPAGEHAKANNITNTSSVYAMGYILDAKATDAQADACATYLKFMYGSEAWKEKIDFAYDNLIEFIAYPAIKTVDLSKIYDDMIRTKPKWKNAIEYALGHAYIGKINSTAYTTEIRGKLSDLISTKNSDELNALLISLENSTNSNWLTLYNQEVLSGK